MKDSDVVKLARRMDKLNEKIKKLVRQIEDSDHPNAKEFVRDLWDNGFDTPAWAVHVIRHRLEHPERWEVGDFGIRIANHKLPGYHLQPNV